MRSSPVARGLIAAGLALSTVGCGSISDAVTSPSRWLGDSSEALGDSSQGSADSSDAFSRSSSGDDEEESLPEARYRNDVRLVAAAWARRTPRPDPAAHDALAREVADVAASYGLARWTEANATWRGLAEGLREAGLGNVDTSRILRALGGPGTSA